MTKLIVGLGNPGEKYQYTRHNCGFMVVEKLVKELLPVVRSEKTWKIEKKFQAEISRPSEDLFVMKPLTFMNLSGEAVGAVSRFYKIQVGDIWIIHDDIDLPLGKVRIRTGGGSGGHNGVESVINSVGVEFVQFRLGIGRGKLDIKQSSDINLHRREIEKYVLLPFREDEAGEVKKLVKNTVTAIKLALEQGVEKAMNRFN